MSNLCMVFPDTIQKQIRRMISKAHGNEIFLIGIANEEGELTHVELLAQGNQNAVAACISNDSQGRRLMRAGNIVIHNHPGGDLTPSDADVELSSYFSTLGMGAVIIDNDASDMYVLVEPKQPEKRLLIEEKQVREIFSQSGILHKKLPSFEFRSEQLHMALHVNNCFNRDGLSLIEAGTGTGKTFAYLVPALLHAQANNERVVVSTNTINLQEQIIKKDVPTLQKIFYKQFRATLIKGRNNYLCKRKMKMVYESQSLFIDEKEQQTLSDIYKWSVKTWDGSLSDLSFTPEHSIWEQVNSEAVSCMRLRCPFHGECFFYRSRKEAAASELLVINHHVMFADLSLRKEVGDLSDIVMLPPYQMLIVDEAHNIEESATSYFSRQLHRFIILRTIRRLYLVRVGRKEFGLLQLLEGSIPKKEHIVREKIETMKMAIINLEEKVNVVFNTFNSFFASFYNERNNNKPTLTITSEVMAQMEYRDHIRDNLILLQQELQVLQEQMKELHDVCAEKTFYKKKKIQSLLADINAVSIKIAEAVVIVQSFLKDEDTVHVRWLNCRRHKNQDVHVSFHIAPIDVSERIHETILAMCRAKVFTSATLAVEGNLRFFKERLGINNAVMQEREDALTELILPSSFDYKKQVFLGVNGFLPSPTSYSFTEELSEHVLRLLKISEGKAFVLFTSYALLNAVAEKLSLPLSMAGIPLLRQGTMNRHALLDLFKKEIHSVLFGTDSFWEGVDVEGESLSNVIITRLPFQVPDDPVFEARANLIRKQGGNPFNDYFVPQAVIKFKQGFGRLIRHRNDYGAVIICDSRIVQKKYGARFLNSLPLCTRVIGDGEAVSSGLSHFLLNAHKEE